MGVDGEGTRVVRCTDWRDGELTFCMLVHKDRVDARRALASLRRHYPGAHVLVISDGDPDRRLDALAQRFGARFHRGERLFPARCGGRVLQRTFELFLERPTRWLIKIDPDTRAHRRFAWLPSGRALFGTLQYETVAAPPFPIVQGGFVGQPLEVVREMHGSGLLLSADLLDHRRSYAQLPHVRERVEVKGLVSTDYITRWLCERLDLPVVSFDEVYSTWGGRIPDPARFAFTHPHKAWSVVLRRQLREPGLVPRKLAQWLGRAVARSAGGAPQSGRERHYDGGHARGDQAPEPVWPAAPRRGCSERSTTER